METRQLDGLQGGNDARGGIRSSPKRRTIASSHTATGIIVLLCALLSACVVTRHPAGIASSSTPVGSDYIEIGPVESSSCASWLLGIPLGGKSDTSAIIEGLVKEKGADALVGVTVEYTGYIFPLPLFGSSCTTVKGQAVRGGK